jgi:hypothetical protein
MGGVVSSLLGGGRMNPARMQAEAEARAEARAKKEREEAALRADNIAQAKMRAQQGRKATLLTDERTSLNASGLLG